MLDSVNASAIPFSYNGESIQLVAGYADGPHAWTPADWSRFPPHVRRVRICIWSNEWSAHMLDVEPTNNNARQAVPWVAGKWERGQTPTVYCFSDKGPEGYRVSDVRRECDLAGVKRPLILITRFAPDAPITPDEFDPTADPEIIGLQYDNSAETGGHFDASVVADHWPGVDPEEEQVDYITRAEFEAYQRDVRETLEGTDGGATQEHGGIKGHINVLRTEHDKHRHDTTGPKPPAAA